MSIVDGSVTHPPGEAPTIHVILKNTGQTPATDLGWRIIFGYALIANAKDIKLDDSKAPRYTLARDHTLTIEYKFTEWSSANDAALQAGIAAIFAVSEVRYKDVFGSSYASFDRLWSGGRFGIPNSGVMPGRWGVAPE